MSNNGHLPELRETVDAALRAKREEQRRREFRPDADDPTLTHPLEYDETGFPIPQRRTSLVRRMARRLKPF